MNIIHFGPGIIVRILYPSILHRCTSLICKRDTSVIAAIDLVDECQEAVCSSGDSRASPNLAVVGGYPSAWCCQNVCDKAEDVMLTWHGPPSTSSDPAE
jgi:hypothetical protein